MPLGCRGALIRNSGLWFRMPASSVPKGTGVLPKSYRVAGVGVEYDKCILNIILSIVDRRQIDVVILNHCAEVVYREAFRGSVSASLVYCHL